jgi:hypothetical protein
MQHRHRYKSVWRTSLAIDVDGGRHKHSTPIGETSLDIPLRHGRHVHAICGVFTLSDEAVDQSDSVA